MMDGFIAFICWTFGISMIFFSAGKRIDIPAYRFDEAISLCQSNEGLKSLDEFTATCVNGAKFDLKSEGP